MDDLEELVELEDMLIERTRGKKESLDEAFRVLSRLVRSADLLERARDNLRRKMRETQRLDSPSGSYDPGDEALSAPWYVPSHSRDKYWPALESRLRAGSLRDAVDVIDSSSTKVVAHLAPPFADRMKKRGLVLGHVQSGKTANYTAVMTKAADAGYKLFIVLSGLHNNLRRQTQVRVTRDVGGLWHPWTNEDEDFGGNVSGRAILEHDIPSLIVIKKNKNRLEALRDWLRNIPEDVRERVPVLLLDDEADQATPNTNRRLQEEKRGINKLVGEIWGEVKKGTYVGYTATPFANVFMNPDDEEELYPADFLITLPRPANYFGAERIMGREPLHEDDDPDPGLEMVRIITDAGDLRPPSNADERMIFDPPLPSSLKDAVRWFVVATAIRAARGQGDEHSSMLVHTTHYVDPHFALQRRIDELLGDFQEEVFHSQWAAFERTFANEAFQVENEATVPMPSWEYVRAEIPDVLDEIRTVVDNGRSEDRLDYGTDKAEKVIAVGGGTLSRGLTLEGLIVSYFTRTSSTYDTLLQMGRWFGFRPGYEDLPRLWLQEGLDEDYRFLALVEEEMRNEISALARERRTPREVGLRIRAHPGRLSIVAPNKMGAASQVQISYSGKRMQTFIFDEANTKIEASGLGTLDHNLEATRKFLGRCEEQSGINPLAGTRHKIARDVSSELVEEFFRDYRFHPDQQSLHPEHVLGWMKQKAHNRLWNVVVFEKSSSRKGSEGSPGDLPGVDLGLGELVNPVNRAPLVTPAASSGVANIKALMSRDDWFLDIGIDRAAKLEQEGDHVNPRQVRKELAEDRGLLVIYSVSKDSVPMGASKRVKSRRPMQAPQDLIGLGIIFPDTDKEGFAPSGDYYSVSPKYEVYSNQDDEELEIIEDLEGTAEAEPILGAM